MTQYKAPYLISVTDFPIADSAYPRIEMLEAKLNEEGKPSSIIKTLGKNYDLMIDKAYEGGPNGKATLNKKLSYEMKAINYDTVELLKEQGVNVMGVGGNGANICHNSGDPLTRCILNGAVGNDKAGKFVKDNLWESGTSLIDFGEILPATREAIAITPRGGKDRLSRSCEWELPKTFTYENLLKAHEESSAIHIQPVITKMISPREAVKLFEELKYGSKEAGSSKLLFYEVSGKDEFYTNKGLVYANYRLAEKAHVVVMNEEEVISWHERKVYKGDPVKLTDPRFIAAARALNRETQMDPKSESERKIRIITLGKLGSIAFAKGIVAHADAKEGVETVNTLGAGDGWISHFAKFYMKKGNQPLNADLLARGMWGSNMLSAEIIQHSQAQIPKELIKKVLDDISKEPLIGKNMHVNEDGTYGSPKLWETFAKGISTEPYNKVGRHYQAKVAASRNDSQDPSLGR